ncbi:unnamed protein product, partial [Cladocopium goreaui]
MDATAGRVVWVAGHVAVRNGRRDPNWRNNVGLLIRWLHPDGTWRHVQIDCGKTFRESKKYGKFPRKFPHEKSDKTGAVLVPTTPVDFLDALLLTHDHADAILGLDELRQLQRFDNATRQVCGPPIQCFCDARTMRHCLARDVFQLGLKTQLSLQLLGAFARLPQAVLFLTCSLAARAPKKGLLHCHVLGEVPEDTSPFEVQGLMIHALPVLHGADYVSFGYGFGPKGSKVVYISDYTELLPRTETLLEHWSQDGIAVMILDMLFPSSQKALVHANLDDSIALVRRYRPRKAFFVGMCHFRCLERRLWVMIGL